MSHRKKKYRLNGAKINLEPFVLVVAVLNIFLKGEITGNYITCQHIVCVYITNKYMIAYRYVVKCFILFDKGKAQTIRILSKFANKIFTDTRFQYKDVTYNYHLDPYNIYMDTIIKLVIYIKHNSIIPITIINISASGKKCFNFHKI